MSVKAQAKTLWHRATDWLPDLLWVDCGYCLFYRGVLVGAIMSAVVMLGIIEYGWSA